MRTRKPESSTKPTCVALGSFKPRIGLFYTRRHAGALGDGGCSLGISAQCDVEGGQRLLDGGDPAMVV